MIADDSNTVATEDPGPAAARPVEPLGPSRFRSRAADIGERYALFLAWIVIIIVFSIAKPSVFPTMSNASSILGSQAVLVFLALALLAPLITGDFDLSVAYTMTFSALVVAVMNGEHHDALIVSILVALAAGAAVGIINGILVVRVGVDAFIATLGTGTFVGGLALAISNSTTVGGVSQTLINVTVADQFLGIPLEFYYGIAFALVLWYVYRFTPLGRRAVAVGKNREVARLSGISVNRVRFGALVVAGVGSALAGIVSAGTSGAADPTSSLTLLLPAYAAVFLGGTALTPGRFNVWGTVAATYFLVTGITGLQLLGVGSYVQELFYGGALVVAVAISVVVRRHTRGAERAA